MRCPRCHADAPPDARFCADCGARLALACSACGAPVPPAARFCPRCATPVVARLPEAPRPASPSPHTYTPKHLAERILTARESLEGERKQVTVLFADLKSSMELLAGRDPEEARRVLDPVLERMMEAVHRYEGTVNQVLGDGIMALFGAPLAHEDHAVRACYAAIRMQDSVREYAEKVRRTHELPLHIRVGLNSGEVVVRSIGSDLHMDYTAVGETTHLAARMEQLAEPGTTLLTAHTLRLVRGYVEAEPLNPVVVKGLAEPVEAFRLLGPGPARSRLQAAAARGLTRFVGREAELAELGRAIERADSGHGQVVGIVGEPGVGKSRLVSEFIHAHLPARWRVIETATVSYGKTTPYLPVAGLLRDYFQIEEGDDARKVLDKVGSRVLALDDSLGAVIPGLLSLLDVPVEDPAWQGLDPAQRRRRILEAVRRLLLREAQAQPLCLVFEDLHWIDSETQSLLDRLIDSLPAARILCLASYRPEYQHGWGNKSYYTQLRVDPLAPGTAQALLHSLLGDAPGLEPLKKRLIEQTEGNPFFLEECVWHLVESGSLVGQRGGYRLTRPVPAVQVPETVQAVLAARIDRLPPEEKRLLQSAAVIGKDMPFPLLAAISDLTENELRRGLLHLQAGEFLYEVSLFPHPEYTFKHALTLEVAAGSLLRERRRALDARIVEALERLYPERPIEQVDRLAHHALRGEVWDKALASCRQAGAKAFARSAHRAATEWFEQALGALEHLPESPDIIAQAIDLRLDLRYALSPLGEFGKMLDHLEEAERLAQSSGDQRRLGLVSAFLTNYYTVMLDLDRATEYGRRAVDIAGEVGDVTVQVLAQTFLGLAYYGLGDYPRAVEFSRRNAELLQGELARERFGMALLPAVYSRTVLVWSLAELGDFEQGLAAGAEALRIAEAVDHPYSLIFARLGLGLLHLRRGEFEKAVTHLERGIAVCRSAEIRVAFATVATPLSTAYASSGRADDAIRLVEEGVAQAAAIGDPFGHWLRTGALGEVYVLAGRAAEALPRARRGLELTRAVKGRGSEAWALRLVAEATGQDPRLTDQAEATYREALERAGQLGMRPLQARCRLGLGSLYRQTGRPELARAELHAAIELFRALGMRYWLARAETELAPLAS